MEGKRELLKERAPMSPVSVDVFNMLRTPALTRASFGGMLGGGERRERDAPVAPDTLLALLLRPLATLETGSVKGIVPPSQACKGVYDGPRRAIQMSKRTRGLASNEGAG